MLIRGMLKRQKRGGEEYHGKKESKEKEEVTGFYPVLNTGYQLINW
jgi:hypothetical protein